MRNKKGSMELSVNSIVILVIAIVIMGLILGFIRTKFSEVGGNLVTNEPEPMPASSEEPLTLSRETVSTVIGGKAVMKVNAYNSEADLVDAKAVVLCQGVSVASKKLEVASGVKDILSGEQATFIITLSPSKSSSIAKSSYLCSVNINTTAEVTAIGKKDFVLMIN